MSMVERRRQKPHYSSGSILFGFAMGSQAVGDIILRRCFVSMGHEGDTPEISAFCPIFLLEQHTTVMLASFHFCGTPPAF